MYGMARPGKTPGGRAAQVLQERWYQIKGRDESKITATGKCGSCRTEKPDLRMVGAAVKLAR